MFGMAGYVDALNVPTIARKVDRVDPVLPQDRSFADIEIARLAIGECGADVGASRVVIHRAKRNARDIAGAPAAERHLVIVTAVELLAAECDPAGGIQTARHIAVIAEAVAISVTVVVTVPIIAVAVVRPREYARPHPIPIRALPPFGLIAADVSSDIACRAATVHWLAVEILEPNHAVHLQRHLDVAPTLH